MMQPISDATNLGDWWYIIPAVILVDCAVIFMTKYPGKAPYFQVQALNKWYEQFGIVAVMSDVLSIMIGIMFTRYIYTFLGLTGWLYFIAILIGFQLFHDIIFYIGVIQPLQPGHNRMIDVFKEYAQENGVKILGADALMMLSSVLLGSLLKTIPDHYTVSAYILTLYALSYILFTK